MRKSHHQIQKLWLEMHHGQQGQFVMGLDRSSTHKQLPNNLLGKWVLMAYHLEGNSHLRGQEDINRILH